MATTTDHYSDSTVTKRPAVRERTSFIRGLGILLVIGGLLGAAAYGSSRFLISGTEAVGDTSTYEVQRRDLLVTVTEDGNVESASNVDIKCEVAGGSSILWIIADGETVKAGDKLVELESSTLEDEINSQRIAFNKAKSLMIQAQKNYEVAQIAVEEYIEGTFKQALQDAEALIVISEEDLRSAKNALEYSERMFQRGYISSQEIETQTFAVQHAQLNLDSAKTAKEVLERFTRRKMVKDLESQVETAEAAMESEDAAFKLEDGKLTRLQTQLEKCTIVAERDGMVVYANERASRSQQATVVEEGAVVRDRQTILRLPDLSQMQVRVLIHETRVEDIRRGMGARIDIQGRELKGHVTSIANQHEPSHWFSGDIKEYATIVKVEGEVEKVKPGMTAEVEIKVAHQQDVLVLPVSAVVEIRGKYFCWVKTGGEPERRELKLGISDDQFVEILSGVEEGEQVIRNPRKLAGSAEDRALEAEDSEPAPQFGEGPADASVPFDGPANRGGGEGGGRAREGGGPGAARGGPGGGPGGGGPGGGGPGAGRGGGGRPNLMSRDADGDGKISKAEAPEFMLQFFDRVDTDKDGYIDQKEIDAMRQMRPGSGGQRGGGQPGGGQGGPGGGGRGGGGGGRP